MNVTPIVRAITKYKDHPLVEQAAKEIRTALGEAAARYAARMESPVLWATFHRLRARQVKAQRWFPGKSLLLAHHWRMCRRYAAMAEAEKLTGHEWSTACAACGDEE